jgi:hypothetical protein
MIVSNTSSQLCSIVLFVTITIPFQSQFWTENPFRPSMVTFFLSLIDKLNDTTSSLNTLTNIVMRVIQTTADLRRSFSEKAKRSIVDITLDCLYFIADYPEAGDAIGIMWSSDPDIFFLCTETFAAFTGRKANTIRRNLHDHGFVTYLKGRRSTIAGRKHRYVAWSHSAIRKGIPRESLGRFHYLPTKSRVETSPLNDYNGQEGLWDLARVCSIEDLEPEWFCDLSRNDWNDDLTG